ncbi:MAG: manB [Bacteroidetes bacterium]|nr:manB [Bacteroidota bacterium]
MPLMVSISGIRGIIGESLTPEVAVRYSSAFGEYCRKGTSTAPTVVVGRDGRVTGKFVTDLIISTLRAKGVNVRDLGICPTPTVQLAVERSGASGGIAVTASHNPIQWNGMKFIASTGMFLDGDENRELWSLAEAAPSYASWDRQGTYVADDSWIGKHIDAVLSLPYINMKTIQARKLKVVVDCINAAGGVIVPQMLRRLGIEVVEMNCDVSGIFSRTPEPIPENLTALTERVRKEGADLGIAVDPDVDRLVLVTEHGEPYGEEYTISSAVKFVLEKETAVQAQKGHRQQMIVVVNLSTTRAVNDIASEYGATCLRTPVGEINVAKRMKLAGAVIGGEGSGGVILPAVHLGRDAIVGIGLLLQMLAESGKTLSGLRMSLPLYYITKAKIETGKSSVEEIFKAVEASYAKDGTINMDDGMKIDFPNSWVHLRKSNTEPIMRIIAEARSNVDAKHLVERLKKDITSYTMWRMPSS